MFMILLALFVSTGVKVTFANDERIDIEEPGPLPDDEKVPEWVVPDPIIDKFDV